MKFSKVFVLFGLILLFGLAACGGGDADTGTSEAEAEAPAVSLADEVRVEEGGYAFQPPVGYEVSVDYIFAEMSVANDDTTQINIIGVPFDEGMTLDTIYEGFTSEMGTDEAVTLGEREAVTVNGLEGFAVTMEGDEDGTAVHGKIVALGNDTQAVVIFGGAEAGKWNDEVAAQLDAMANTITLFEAVTE